ncbi:hypothetical protein [Agrobacterium tumefaciens]|uniref:hypothetical protein n=1 Tax=Agrobacterium tumefaciens TaxID=358 RepID=UPI00287C3815|nr:hypothetical protein [Agrobacterium tumefaciens]MDS7594255.1 hypothetical protein [Agrobacterium tumefaciens]
MLTHWRWVCAIPKTSSVEHVEENAVASEMQFSQAEIARIDAALRGSRRRGLPMI